ncbi:hypothetical protein [Bacillus alveayuensis]|jgi:hypothetical protein|uniref:Uncharacterized protein n=1 Tax=Aeribacillus alveayuensis TaxID=279215 RepID=A0ABT9VMU2_9BACI|nr:hypothetical protein [Bacillus alveayuensis]MDQ0162288.1 hypothetical protein [Bacillus alveayuensis]
MDQEKERDFKELNDRLIADPPKGPLLAIKTNLDPKDVLEDNPYVKSAEEEMKKDELEEFFDDGAN